MIRKKDLLPILRASSKIFDEIADKELRQSQFSLWRDENGDLCHYTILGDYAHHIIDLYKAEKLDGFGDIFELIEQLHLKGDDYIKNAATIGVLEGIQNIAGNSSVVPAVFVNYLQPESLKWWNSLNEFWNGEVPRVGFNIKNETNLMFCKKCNQLLNPTLEMINDPEPWEKDGSRCSHCNYLYYQNYRETWYAEVWKKDYIDKMEAILAKSYANTDNKEVYRYSFFYLA